MVAMCLGPPRASPNRPTGRELPAVGWLSGKRDGSAPRYVRAGRSSVVLFKLTPWLYQGNSLLGYKSCRRHREVPAGGAEVVMATALRSQFSLLGIELREQNCLVSSITKCGNIDDGV